MYFYIRKKPESYSEKILAIPAIDTTRLLAHKTLAYANE
ncbi:hypothetical protein BH10PSE19_BH10PSE19_01200 [soil metagenome]